MFMDYREQQPGEHDFEYAARILGAASTNFRAMLANGSYSLADLRKIRQHLLGVIDKELSTSITDPRTASEAHPCQ